MRTLTYLSTIAVLAATAVWAQPDVDEGGCRRHGRREMFSPEERLERMSRALELTDAQKNAVGAILEAQREKLDELREEGGDPREKRKDARDLREQGFAQINALLSPDQQARHNEIRRRIEMRMKQRRHERRGRSEEGVPFERGAPGPRTDNF